MLEGAEPDSTWGRGTGEAPWLRSWDGSQLEPHALIRSLFPCAQDFVPLRQLFGGRGCLGEISWGVSVRPLIAIAKGVRYLQAWVEEQALPSQPSMPCGCSGPGDPVDAMPTLGEGDPVDAMPTPGELWHPTSAGRGAGVGHFVAQHARAGGLLSVPGTGLVVPVCTWTHVGSAAWEAGGLVTAWARLTCCGPPSREAGAGAGTPPGG